MIEEGGDVAAFESFTIDDAGGEKEAPSEAPKEEASESSEPSSSGSKTAPPSGDKESSGSPIKSQESDSTGSRLETSLDRQPKIAPAAKKLALEKGVPIGQIKGSGKGGQITKEDIEKYKPSGGAAATGASAGGPTYEDTPASS